MESLSVCADMTSGTVNIVNPLELVRQIRLISQNPVIATGISAKLILPKGWLWETIEEPPKNDAKGADTKKKKGKGKNEKEAQKTKKKQKPSNILEHNVGNATDATNLSFPFILNPKVGPYR